MDYQNVPDIIENADDDAPDISPGVVELTSSPPSSKSFGNEQHSHSQPLFQQTQTINTKCKRFKCVAIIFCILLIIAIIISIRYITTNSSTESPLLGFTSNPTSEPTANEQLDPVPMPTTAPFVPSSFYPTTDPNKSPSSNPTATPSFHPTFNPTNEPTAPSFDPTFIPTFNPTNNPTNTPSTNPTIDPTTDPSISPTSDPTINPTNSPSYNPTNTPSFEPTNNPSTAPTFEPTTNPTDKPSFNPSNTPSFNPSFNPSNTPTVEPTIIPTNSPSNNPTNNPSFNPTTDPTMSPTFPLPVPGELTRINGTNHSFTLHNSTVYMDHHMITECIMNTDDNNHLLNTSYIMIPYDHSVDLNNTNFLIASKLSVDILPSNCTEFPALKIIQKEVHHSNNGIYTKLFVVEAYFWEYFETLDVNISNISVSDNEEPFEPSDESMAKQFTETTNLTDITYDTVPVDCSNLNSSQCIDLYSGINNDIFSGSGTRRLLEWDKSATLRINPEFQTKLKAGDVGNGIGFTLKAGIDFHATFTVSFDCKFNIFSGFEKFKFMIAMETALKAYINMTINTVNFVQKIKEQKTKPHIIWIGPIPVTFELYGALYIGIEVRDFEFSLGLQIGYKPVSYMFGVEYTKKNGWKQIDKGDKFKFIAKFDYKLDNSGGCEVIIQPSLQFRVGVVFYELIDAYISTVLAVPITLTYPANNGCGDHLNCSDTLNSLGMHIELWDELYIGIILDNIKWYFKPIVNVIEPAPLKLASWKLKEWDTCFDVDSTKLFDWCCKTTISPRPTTHVMAITPSPTDGCLDIYNITIFVLLFVNMFSLCIM